MDLSPATSELGKSNQVGKCVIWVAVFIALKSVFEGELRQKSLGLY